MAAGRNRRVVGAAVVQSTHPHGTGHSVDVAVGDAAAVERLLNYKADPTNAEIKGISILHYAAANGLLKIVTLLIQHGVPVDKPGPQGLTPLFSALESKANNNEAVI